MLRRNEGTNYVIIMIMIIILNDYKYYTVETKGRVEV